MAVFSRLRTLVRLARHGEWQTVRANLERRTLPKALWFRNRLALVRLSRAPRGSHLPLDHVRVREITVEDVDRLQEIRPRSDRYAGPFRAGHLGFIAEVDGRPAGFVWFVPGGVHRSRVNLYEIDLGDTGAYSYGVEVKPEFRMKGVIVKLWAEAYRGLVERGIHTVFAAIPTENELSVNTHSKLGFEVEHDVSVFRMLGVSGHVSRSPRGGGERRGWGRFVWPHRRESVHERSAVGSARTSRSLARAIAAKEGSP